MKLKIALIGNPNCGKTTMYNEITGSTQYVGNWPGVTVEKKEGLVKGHSEALLVDLPGIYSLSPYSLEERITRNYLSDGKPDAVINIVDSTNIERGLYLTTQLLEMDIPVLVALNMTDAAEKAGIKIDEKVLSEKLGCRAIKCSASDGTGVDEVLKNALEISTKKERPIQKIRFSDEVEGALKQISSISSQFVAEHPLRWVSVNLFNRDAVLKEHLAIDDKNLLSIDKLITSCEELKDDDSESIIANERYSFIDKVLSEALSGKSKGDVSQSDRIDAIVTNRLLGLPIFFLIMWGVYYVSIQSLGDMSIGWTETFFGDWIGGTLSSWLEAANAAEWLQGLVVDGFVGGIGAVMGFVPQIMILFFFISFLEDCGYMARVAFLMDRLFRQFGLSGKSFIPMLIGTGCSVPGIMACRTIENEKDRRLTMILTPFIPCSAKLPVFALFVATFFPDHSWVGPSMYILGIGAVIISGIILKKMPFFAGEPAPFVMELPTYRMPRIKGVMIHMWERGKAFMIKAGTVIFIAAGLIWFLQAFNWSLEMVEAGESILASMGRVIAPIFAPLGFGTWQSSMAVVTGFLAKEVVVATYGVLFGLGEVAEDNPDLINSITQLFTPVSAYSFMVFTLLASPCFAALAAIKSEMRSWKWTFFAMAWQTGLAYIMAFVIYQIGSRIVA